MEKWHPRTQIRINLSAIKNVIVLAEEGIVDFEKRRRRRLSFWEEWKNDGEGESRDWELIQVLKTQFKVFEKCGSSFEAFKNSEFVEKVKSSLVSLWGRHRRHSRGTPTMKMLTGATNRARIALGSRFGAARGFGSVLAGLGTR
ncbi:hypothetical protein JHK87_009673 [Glycine soja]|nr:hypothetical protein JHK87_009673 [Glycine soja]